MYAIRSYYVCNSTVIFRCAKYGHFFRQAAAQPYHTALGVVFYFADMLPFQFHDLTRIGEHTRSGSCNVARKQSKRDKKAVYNTIPFLLRCLCVVCDAVIVNNKASYNFV